MPPVMLTDADVFEAIYPAVRRFASFVAASGVEPDDLIQEALARVLTRAPLTEVDDLLAYLRTTMINIVRNEHRRLGREERAWVRSGVRRVSERDPRAEGRDLAGTDAVARVLGSLPPPTRAAVFLVDLEGWSIADAATALGLSVAATTARLSRARRTLRRRVGLMEEMEP